MTQGWVTLDRVETSDGTLELRSRGERDFLILIAGRVLMNSSAHRSEQALASEACARLSTRASPSLLIGGLGMGFTLRAALAPGGVYAVWSERPDPAFERRLRAAGFAAVRSRPGRGGLRHAVYTAQAVR